MAYVILTVVLGLIMIGIIIYYYRNSVKESVEQPKYDILNDDEEISDGKSGKTKT